MKTNGLTAHDWKNAVIDALVVQHAYHAEHDHDPVKALNAAIHWNVQVALDPAVSSDAQALIDKGRKDGLLEAAKVCAARAINAAAAADCACDLEDRLDCLKEQETALYCERDIRALAAQEDQREPAQCNPVENTTRPTGRSASSESGSHPTTADDLLRECLDWGLPDDLKQRIDAAIEGEKK